MLMALTISGPAPRMQLLLRHITYAFMLTTCTRNTMNTQIDIVALKNNKAMELATAVMRVDEAHVVGQVPGARSCRERRRRPEIANSSSLVTASTQIH